VKNAVISARNKKREICSMTVKVEPFKIKVVEPIKLISKNERLKKMEEARYNIFRLKGEDVYIDLLTDSGTSAMSDHQWAGIMEGDESYAGSKSFFNLERVIKKITGFEYVVPTHQGRPAENILFSQLIKPGDVVPGNAHFDSTQAHIIHKGGKAVNLLLDEAYDPKTYHPFKGNVNIEQLENLIKSQRDNIPFFLMTVTNNTIGGQPVSMENLRRTRKLLSGFGIPMYIDAARFAENAYFIKLREPGYGEKEVKDIVREMFSYADGCIMSAKKDGLVNIGGFIALNDKKLYEQCCELLILLEGFITYGGMAGRDLEALARGLEEVIEEDYLAYRIDQVNYLGKKLDDAGIPIVQPPGGHGIYIDAKSVFPRIPQSQFPAYTLVVEMYIEAGVRAAEIGSVAFAKKDEITGKTDYPRLELTRLAVPRRVYTYRHMDFVAEGVIHVAKKKDKVKGFKIAYEPKTLRHFLADFARVE